MSTPHRPAIVGLTGGIGSGKSTVAALFEQQGFAVYRADDGAKEIMTADNLLKAAIVALFGEESYLPGGTLNRAFIGSIVFHDETQLARLNALVHPAVKRHFEAWLTRLLGEGYRKPFVLREAAILYESGTYTDCDAVIAVYAPKTLRVARCMKRDGVDATAILARMQKQWPETEKLRRADWVVYNDGAHSLEAQVAALGRADTALRPPSGP